MASAKFSSSTRRRRFGRAWLSLAAAATLTLGIAVPGAVPELPSSQIAQAQSPEVTLGEVKLTGGSAEGERNLRTFSTQVQQSGALNRVEVSVAFDEDGTEPRWGEKITLKVGGTTLSSDNAKPKVKDGVATWSIPLTTPIEVAAGDKVELQVRENAGAQLSEPKMKVQGQQVATSTTSPSAPAASGSEATTSTGPSTTSSKESEASESSATSAPEESESAESETASSEEAAPGEEANAEEEREEPVPGGAGFRALQEGEFEGYVVPNGEKLSIGANGKHVLDLRILPGRTPDKRLPYTLPAGAEIEIRFKGNFGALTETTQFRYGSEIQRELIIGDAKYEDLGGNAFRATLPEITLHPSFGANGRIVLDGISARSLADFRNATIYFRFPNQNANVCTAESTQVRKKHPRQPTDAEFAAGSPVYVVTGFPTDDSRNRSILSRQSDQGATFDEVGRSNWLYNALMYNQNDHWLYAISQERGLSGDICFPAGHLLQIDPSNGRAYNLGPLVGSGGVDVPWFHPEDPRDNSDRDRGRKYLNSGVLTSQGYFVANTSGSGSGRIYKVNLNTRVTERAFGDNWSDSEDWAVVPGAEHVMWGIKSRGGRYNNAPVRDRIVIERIDTRLGRFRSIEISNLRAPDGRRITSTSASWGKAWTISNGNLGFGTGSTGAGQNGFELKIINPGSTNPEFELVGLTENLPASFNTDAASSVSEIPERYRANLKISKQRTETRQVGNEVRTYWTVTVENTSNITSAGGTFTEIFPTSTHYGVRTFPPTARFEGFGPGSSLVNGRRPGPNETGADAGIFAGVNRPLIVFGEQANLTAFVGTMPAGKKVEFIFSAPVRTDRNGNVATVCTPNRVRFTSTDIESEPATSDNVAVESCVNKVAVDTEPQPVPGTTNEFTARYNVVVQYPHVAGFESNDVVYGRLIDTPQFVRAADVLGATVTFRDEFNRAQPPQSFTGPYDLNGSGNPRITRPAGVGNSTGQHVYEVTVRFRLDPSRLDQSAVPPNFPAQPAGNYRCYTDGSNHAPNFGLVNKVEMGGSATSTDCIPLTPQEKKMTIFLEKVSYNPDAPNQLQTDNLLPGAEFVVHRGDTNGNLNLVGTEVNLDSNPIVAQVQSDVAGRVELRGLDAPGVYYLIETKAPAGHNLLPSPVKFATNWASDGSAEIEILSGAGLATSGNQCSRRTSNCDNTIGILQIADVTKGELPKTGGSGVAVGLVGLTLVGAGWVVTRRRTA